MDPSYLNSYRPIALTGLLRVPGYLESQNLSVASDDRVGNMAVICKLAVSLVLILNIFKSAWTLCLGQERCCLLCT